MARSGNTCIVGQLCVRGEARIVLPQSRSVKSQRRGKAVGMCFDRYEKEAVRVAVARLGSELALAAFAAGSDRPSYVILLAWEGGRVQRIRDFRYVPYIVDEAELELV
jgi:hypothetical protein